MSRHSRLVPAVLVLVLLSASPALPQTRRGGAPPSPASFAEALRELLPDFLTRLWGQGGAGRPAVSRPATPASHTAIWADLGCDIDPYGRCKTTSQQASDH
jgi:hypothetical protein